MSRFSEITPRYCRKYLYMVVLLQVLWEVKPPHVPPYPSPADISATSVSDNSRTLHFNLSNIIKPTMRILAVDLVLKQTPGASSYGTHLHEITGDDTDMDLKLLDSGMYRGGWHTLRVKNLVDSVDGASGRRNYELLLSISGGEEAEDVLRKAKPMLLIYTNDLEVGGSPYGAADMGATNDRDESRSRTRSRTKESREEYGESQSASEESHRRRRRAASPASSPCQKHSVLTNYSQLGWPVDSRVLSGNTVRFHFCSGSCALSLNPSSTSYSNHAKLLAHSVLRSHVAPCCVPIEYTPVPIRYVDLYSRFMTITTYPVASSCGCR